MQQLVPMYIAIAFVVALSSKSEAKRGCALYGHSCYGGHGKRSDIPIQPSINIPDSSVSNKEYLDPNKEIPLMANNMRSGNSALEHENKQLQFVVYDLLRQLMEYRRSAQNFDETDNLNDVIFQRNK